ncbi:fungal specific transcription factor [Paramyrothecium foliicola]|nr:fungal specific transcription factor [Paramyrothecium foliicola]
MSRKLDRIWLAVDNIPAASKPSEEWRPNLTGADGSPETSSAAYTQGDESSDTETEVELSLTGHAAFASDYAQKAIGDSPVTQDMKGSLQALRQVVDKEQTESGTSRESPLQIATSNSWKSQMPLPPMQVAMACIQRLQARELPQILFHEGWDFHTIGKFLEYLLAAYSAEASIIDLIIANSGLSGLFKECSKLEVTPVPRTDLDLYASRCRQNTEALLSRLPFNLPSTLEVVLALYIASVHYLNRCQPSKAWRFIVSASHMAQAMGFHREVALKKEATEDKERRVRLFWLILFVEKPLSLRLGQASTIREGDVGLARVGLGNNGPCSVPILPKWIEYAFTVGKIYDDIFSPGSLRQPESLRVVRARALAKELQTVYESESTPEDSNVSLKQWENNLDHRTQLLFNADKINHLAIMTLIYRSIPASPYSGCLFCEECVATAHEALEVHQTCLAILKTLERDLVEHYIQWALLAAPFVPFIVLFCRVIETSDALHLEKLSSVVETLQFVPTDFPAAFKKQLRLFKLMYDVACKFVEAQRNQGSNDTTIPNSDGDIEILFREAGLSLQVQSPPTGIGAINRSSGHSAYDPGLGSASVDMGLLQETFVTRMENHGAELGHWFDQNHQMFRMLDDIDGDI